MNFLKRNLTYIVLGLLGFVGGVALAVPGELIPLKAFLKNGLRNISSGLTLLIDSDTGDSTTSTTTAAITLAATKDVADGDLVVNVENSAGDNLMTVDEQGLLTVLTDFKAAGNDLTCTGTGATCNLTSDANDTTVSATTAAVTLKTSVNVTSGDLILNVENSTGDNLFTVDEQGAAVHLTDVTVAGNDYNCSGTAATCNVSSSTADGTTSGTVGSITLKAAADIAAADLLVDMQDSSGNHAFTVTEAGAAVALTTVQGTTGVIIGSAGTAIDDSYAGSTAHTYGYLDAGSCGDSPEVALAGAAFGDPCFAAYSDQAQPTQTELDCFVSSAGNVKVRLCAGDTSATYADAGFTFRVIDP